MIENLDLIIAIDKVRTAGSKRAALEKAYEIVTSRYRGRRFMTYLLFWKFFEWDPDRLWKRRGFLHCTHHNLLMKTLLVESGWFEEDEVKYGYALVWYVSPHQYLKVKLDGKWMAVDTWNSVYGVGFGRYASGFGSKELDR